MRGGIIGTMTGGKGTITGGIGTITGGTEVDCALFRSSFCTWPETGWRS
jgi:hypothetical protein